jgi:hypothetical protein
VGNCEPVQDRLAEAVRTLALRRVRLQVTAGLEVPRRPGRDAAFEDRLLGAVVVDPDAGFGGDDLHIELRAETVGVGQCLLHIRSVDVAHFDVQVLTIEADHENLVVGVVDLPDDNLRNLRRQVSDGLGDRHRVGAGLVRPVV